MITENDTPRYLDTRTLPDGQRAGLRHIMEAISQELADLGQLGTRLQATLSPMRQPEHEGLQTLDLLTQSVFALAEFVAALAPSIDPGFRADPAPALARIRLSDLATRIAKVSYASVPAERFACVPPHVETGVMDLL